MEVTKADTFTETSALGEAGTTTLPADGTSASDAEREIATTAATTTAPPRTESSESESEGNDERRFESEKEGDGEDEGTEQAASGDSESSGPAAPSPKARIAGYEEHEGDEHGQGSTTAVAIEKDAAADLANEEPEGEPNEATPTPAGAAMGLFGMPSVPLPPPPGSKDGLKEILETTRMLEAKERGLGRKYLKEAIAARQEPKKTTLCGDSSSMMPERCGDSSAMVTENHHGVLGTTEFLFCLNGIPPSDCCDDEAGEPHFEQGAFDDGSTSGDVAAWEEGKADDGDHDSAANEPTQAEVAQQFYAETRAMEQAEAELAAAETSLSSSSEGTTRNVRFRSLRKASARATGVSGLFRASSRKQQLSQLKAEAEAAAP